MDLAVSYNLYVAAWYLDPVGWGGVEPEFRRYALEEVERRQLTPRERRSWLVASILAERLPSGDVRTEAELYHKMGAVAGENIRRHFWTYLRGRVRELWRGVAGQPFELWRDRMEPSARECLRDGHWGTLALKLFNFVVWPLIVLPLTAVGLWWAVRRRDACAQPLATALAGLLTFILAMALIMGNPRFRVPYDPPLLTAATLGCYVAVRRWGPATGAAGQRRPRGSPDGTDIPAL